MKTIIRNTIFPTALTILLSATLFGCGNSKSPSESDPGSTNQQQLVPPAPTIPILGMEVSTVQVKKATDFSFSTLRADGDNLYTLDNAIGLYPPDQYPAGVGETLYFYFLLPAGTKAFSAMPGDVNSDSKFLFASGDEMNFIPTVDELGNRQQVVVDMIAVKLTEPLSQGTGIFNVDFSDPNGNLLSTAKFQIEMIATQD